jgi:predicted metal-dependent HD superfamily phosphohydrolase
VLASKPQSGQARSSTQVQSFESGCSIRLMLWPRAGAALSIFRLPVPWDDDRTDGRKYMILVDEARWPWRGRMWAHLVSDTSYDELHAFASSLGIPRHSFQGDHYDIPSDYRTAALELGAHAVSSRELLSRLRQAGLRQKPGRSAASDWVAAVAHLGGDVSMARASGADLEHRYREPHRRYHTVEHVATVLRHAASLSGELGLDDRSRAVVALAVCAHDVVYEGRVGKDEEESAKWAATNLAACGLGQSEITSVTAAVLATARHQADPSDLDPVIAVVLDADLAILAARSDVYERYATNVRLEYPQLDEAAWRSGRSSVLASMAERDALYVTEAGRARWETRARANVARELADLDGLRESR